MCTQAPERRDPRTRRARGHDRRGRQADAGRGGGRECRAGGLDGDTRRPRPARCGAPDPSRGRGQAHDRHLAASHRVRMHRGVTPRRRSSHPCRLPGAARGCRAQAHGRRRCGGYPHRCGGGACTRTGGGADGGGGRDLQRGAECGGRGALALRPGVGAGAGAHGGRRDAGGSRTARTRERGRTGASHRGGARPGPARDPLRDCGDRARNTRAIPGVGASRRHTPPRARDRGGRSRGKGALPDAAGSVGGGRTRPGGGDGSAPGEGVERRAVGDDHRYDRGRADGASDHPGPDPMVGATAPVAGDPARLEHRAAAPEGARTR